jgi:RNA polymerase sigma factor (TIGR02999 family)
VGNQSGQEYESRIRALLSAIRHGDRSAFDTLIDAIGGEMRRLSAYHLRNRPPAHTVQTTVLVNEAVVRLIQMLNRKAERFPETREHLMALMSQMMRYTLIDYARKRKVELVSLDQPRHGDDDDGSVSPADALLRDWSERDLDSLLAIEEALNAIERADPEYGKRRSAAIALHLFSGMNFQEIAEELGVTDDMARRDCQIALSRLRDMLSDLPPSRAET